MRPYSVSGTNWHVHLREGLDCWGAIRGADCLCPQLRILSEQDRDSEARALCGCCNGYVSAVDEYRMRNDEIAWSEDRAWR